jgi:uncharacterized phage protein gp47/JayE
MEYLSPPLEANPSSLLALFHEAMELAIPGWSPAPGNLDERIAGAQSLIDAQLMEAASDGATNVFRFFGANIAGIPPNEATFATGVTTWVATDTLGYTIPSGTVAVWVDGTGNRQGFETLEAAVIAPGAKEVAGVAIRALNAGTSGNSLTGAAAELATPLSFVSSATLTSPTNGGLEAESDQAYLTRLVEELKTLSPKAIVPNDFNIILTGKAGVGRATTIRGYNPAGTLKAKAKLTNASAELTGLTSAQTEQIAVGTGVTGTGIPASTFVISVGTTTLILSNKATETKENELTFTGTLRNGGFVTSWVGNENGEALSSGVMAALEAELQEQTLAGVEYCVKAPTTTTVNVEVTVAAWPGQSAATIKAAVEAAITNYLSPARWGQPPTGQTKEWNNDPKVRLTSVYKAILDVVGTHFVSALTLNGAAEDVSMTGVVALPKLGTLSVTVNIA